MNLNIFDFCDISHNFIIFSSAKMFADKYHWIKSNKDVNEEAADAYRVIIAMTEIIANFAKTGQVQIDLELFDFFDSQNNNIEAKQRMSHIL